MIRRILALACSLLLLLTAACAAPVQPGDDIPDAGSAGAPLPADPPPAEDVSPAGDLPEEEGTELPDSAAGEGGAAAEEAGEAETGERTLDPEKPMVALTYDDGPHAVYTDQILDILEENRAVATFFEVGRYLYNDADAVRRAEAMGCEVGSHSYRHADLGKLSKEAILSDLDKADANFQDVLGHKPNLLRPPYGSLSRTLRSVTGRSLIAWSIDTEDWLSRDVEKILAKVREAGDLNGQVILMHSTYDTSVEASRVLIPWLIEQGYQPVTVTELITLHYGDTLQANGLYNYEYFHFGYPVSLPAAAPVSPPETPPVTDPGPPPPESPGELPTEGTEQPGETEEAEGTEPPEGEREPGETPDEPPPEPPPDGAEEPETPPADGEAGENPPPDSGVEEPA